MIEVDALLFILVTEVAIAASLVLAWLGVRALRRRARTERLTREMLGGGEDEASGQEPGQPPGERPDQDGLAAWLRGEVGLSDEPLDATLDAIRGQRDQVLRQALQLALQGHGGALPGLRAELDALVQAFTRLQLASAGPGLEAGDFSPDELEELRDRNQQLTEELGITQQTIDKMLSEYAAAYGGGDVAAASGDEAAAEQLPFADDALEFSADGGDDAPEEAPGGSEERLPDPAEELMTLPESFDEMEERPAGTAAR